MKELKMDESRKRFYVDGPGITYDGAIESLKSMQTVAVDTETTGLDIWYDKVILLQIGTLSSPFVFNVSALEGLMDPIFAILKNDKIKKVFHNAQFDYKFIKTNFGVSVKNIYCTMIAEKLMNQSKFSGFSLKAVAQKYASVKLDKKERESFIGLELGCEITDEQIIYAQNDITYLLNIYKNQSPLLKKYGIKELFDMEMEVLPILGDMTINGIYLDKKKWVELEKAAKKNLEIKRAELDKLFFDVYDTESNLFNAVFVNYDSPKQVLPLLKSLTGLDLPSTDATVLEAFSNEHEAIKALTDYRKEQKKVSTYGICFFKNISPVTDRIHSDFAQLGASTGRMSSRDPNMQNIPRSQKYRTPFCVQYEDEAFISADFSG